jgi:lipoprotein-anchoring transpeptidase ErfK/SrfK
MPDFTRLLTAAAVAALACACSQETRTTTTAQTPADAPPSYADFIARANAAGYFAPPAPGEAPAAPETPAAAEAAATPVTAPNPTLVRAQVLLDRARFSPGVIDGLYGENVRQAIAAYEKAKGLPVDGLLDEQVWQALSADTRPTLANYVITQADVAGPFTAEIPKDETEMAKLKQLGYRGPLELLAERFHMDEDLLTALNPGVDFAKVGAKITVADPGPQDLGVQVTRIEVDKVEKAVRAFDQAGTLVAFYPATIGSNDMPTPAGTWKVNGVARNPTWQYDPSKLSFGKSKVKLTIPAGPNNPVGAVWIDLNKPTYGIHGAPEPEKIGKTESHGCVRLTNWDVQQLATAVKPGTVVEFVKG